MKKLFALLSTFVLTLAIVGLAAKAPEALADSDKWTEDPTLAEDEIPMYEMGSIYTTFPNYYDNAAKKDDAWGGSTRMYPWNETRLRVAEYDATGTATGKYYAIFFSGLTSPTNSDGSPASGAGNNVNGYAYKEDGTLTTVRVKVNNGGYTYDATPADPSLSHLRVNFTGEDISVNMIDLSNRIGDGSNSQNMYNRMFVFDGQGRIIRGVGTDGFYLQAGTDGAAADVWAPEFCYVDGKVVKYEEGVVCDKLQKEVVDEEGNPVIGEDGNPVLEPTDQDNFLYKRFMWEWFEEKPANVNTASYLAEGWDCDLWDYVYEVDGGWMAIAFLNGEGTNHKIKDNEREVTNATRAAAGLAALPEGDYFRACVAEIRIPANGGTFDFGYLDKGVVSELTKFNNIIRGSFMSGRTVESAKVKTYNFSSKPLSTLDMVVDGYSYQLMNGKNYIEVIKGQSFAPAKNVSYEGLASVWTRPDDVTSFAKDLNGLDYSLYVDGAMVVYKYPYADKAEMIADFENDVRAWFAPGTAAGGTEGKWQDFTVDQTQTVGWDFISTSYNANCFWANAANREKWAWMVNYVAEVRKANGLSASHWETIDQGLTASPGTFNAEIQAFLNDTICNPGAWNRTSDYTTGEGATEQTIQNANGFLPKESNQSAFLNYTIDTTDARIDQHYEVKFVVKNATGLESSLVLNYVVVDEYTPIIELNKNSVFIQPQEVDGKTVIEAIDPTVFVNAYNGRYNGKDIKGDSIIQNVHFESATLDFANPTEGEHKVTASVYNDVRHYAELTFTVYIADVTAPQVDFYSDLVLPYGTTWDAKLAVKSAYDTVDGNLQQASFVWCIEDKAVKTTKPGTQKVKIEVYDKSGNCTASKSISVTVLDKNITVEDLQEALAETGIASKLENVELSLLDITDAINNLPQDEDIDAILAAIAGIETSGSKVEAAACATSSLSSVFQFLAAGGLLVFLLRKKH